MHLFFGAGRTQECRLVLFPTVAVHTKALYEVEWPETGCNHHAGCAVKPRDNRKYKSQFGCMKILIVIKSIETHKFEIVARRLVSGRSVNIGLELNGVFWLSRECLNIK
jgi:hypothetical protein